MPDRDDETPTSPAIAQQLERINERVRRRSSQAIETARVQASLILVALDLAHDDPRGETIATKLRSFVEEATRVLRYERDEIEADRDGLKAQLRGMLRDRSESR